MEDYCAERGKGFYGRRQNEDKTQRTYEWLLLIASWIFPSAKVGMEDAGPGTQGLDDETSFGQTT